MNKALFGACGVLCLVVSSAAMSADGQPDALPNSPEDICAELLDATPGLYGICIAFNVGMACEPDFSQEDPFADCPGGSQVLLDLYEKRRGAGDPPMPGLGGDCPCWTSGELAALRHPDAQDTTQCFLDSNASGNTNLDQWTIATDEGPN
ncbi:MAG: hypothetical protein P8Y95_09500, partial [Gammaproteobacteria bacterium]